MDKFRIAKYGMMQVTAIVYGMLASGAAVKLWKLRVGALNRSPAEYSMPSGYHLAAFFRDYGFSLFTIVIVWTILAAYLSSSLSPWEFDPDHVAMSGLVLAILLAFLATFFVCLGINSF